MSERYILFRTYLKILYFMSKILIYSILDIKYDTRTLSKKNIIAKIPKLMKVLSIVPCTKLFINAASNKGVKIFNIAKIRLKHFYVLLFRK